MNSQTTHQTATWSSAAQTAHSECCREPDCGAGLRNNYFEGKRLTPASFQVEQGYMLERRRLLNRAIHGWGVVYGYGITIGASQECRTTATKVLRIGAGLALDPCGRELLQRETEIEIGDVIWFDAKGERRKAEEAFAEPGAAQTCWLLKVHYAEQSTDPVKIKDPCSCEHHEWDHTCETVRYSLQPVPCAACCQADDCELDCACSAGPCCGGTQHDGQTRPAKLSKRGGCRCLCEHLTQWTPESKCGSLCELKEACGRVKVDLQYGVALACLELVPDEYKRAAFGKVHDACGPRRLVKRNDLLFDLIRGCDLTRISEISWKDWHRSKKAIEFQQFSDFFGKDGYRQAEYVTRFAVNFSGPVREDTLRPACFAMTLLCREREGNWWQTFRVPIVRLEYEAAELVGHVSGAKLVVAGAWVEDGLRGRGSVFDYETRVEIEVRGDFIVDCNGQTVDANAVGLSPAPTGNGTPGGTFLSTFRVEPMRSIPYDSEEHQKGDSL